MIEASLIEQIRQNMDLPGDPGQHRVVVAMSGGVDSSAAAALLKAAGYDVLGITLQLYDHGQALGKKGACCAGQDIKDARHCADKLSIPHYVLDFESRFRQAVIEEFADSYLRGQTPIPCVTCNRTVKFSDLLEKARMLKASALATGHYVASRKRSESAHRDLLTPVDLSRDQSYFLFATRQEQVDFLRFPLQSLTKPHIRAIAEQFGLAVADKPDSQDICFVPQGRYKDVVLKLRPEASCPGEIVDEVGNVLGEHPGIVNFTVGQRRGIGIGGGDPLYVIAIDADKKQVVVGPKSALLKKDVYLREVNWLGESLEGTEKHEIFVKVRSVRPPKPAFLSLARDCAYAHVELCDAEEGIAPGQACVFYERAGEGARVLGGGIITERLRDCS